MKILHIIAFTLTIVGALNWGLVGLFKYNLVESLLGSTGLVNVIYILVGVSAVFEVLTHTKNCRTCTEKNKGE